MLHDTHNKRGQVRQSYAVLVCGECHMPHPAPANRPEGPMIAVIFRAEIAELDDDYHETANRLRELAMREYGCTNFISSTQGNQEIAISYWPSRSHIDKWRVDPEHRSAQAKGKARWYRSYQVEIAEIQSYYGTDG